MKLEILKFHRIPRTYSALHLTFLSTTLLYICLSFTHLSANEEPTSKSKLSSAENIKIYVQRLHDENQFNGIVLYAEEGKIKYHEALGFNGFKGSKKLSKKSVFRLASVAKAFTAMVTHLLELENRLSLDDPIEKYLKPFPYSGVTLQHLIHHTSGLPDYVSLLDQKWDVENKGKPNRKYATNRDALRLLRKHQPKIRFKPGMKYEYSNTGYILLALIAEKITGKEFKDILNQKIFKPCNMKHTTLFTPLKPPKIENRTYGYRIEENQRIPNDNNYLNAMYGDGEVYSNAEDLLKWDRALRSDLFGTAKSLERLYKPASLNNGKKSQYGFGWGIGRQGKDRFVHHSGGWVGYRTHIFRNLDADRTLIVLTNNTNPKFRQIIKKLTFLCRK